MSMQLNSKGHFVISTWHIHIHMHRHGSYYTGHENGNYNCFVLNSMGRPSSSHGYLPTALLDVILYTSVLYAECPDFEVSAMYSGVEKWGGQSVFAPPPQY